MAVGLVAPRYLESATPIPDSRLPLPDPIPDPRSVDLKVDGYIGTGSRADER
jgi:hypothetical protein